MLQLTRESERQAALIELVRAHEEYDYLRRSKLRHAANRLKARRFIRRCQLVYLANYTNRDIQ